MTENDEQREVLRELEELHAEGWCACQSSTLPARIENALRDAITQRDAAVREMHARELHHFEEEQLRARAEGTLAAIRELLGTSTDERGITWWEWIDGGLGGDLHARLRALLKPGRGAAQQCRECSEGKHGACNGVALVDEGLHVLEVDCICESGGHDA